MEIEREMEKGRGGGEERAKREDRKKIDRESERGIFETDKQAKNGKKMCKTSYSRKKTEVEMVTAKQCEINERDATTYKGSWKGRS